MKSMDPKEGAQLLLSSGLLFEINRRVLHPLGLALSVHCEDGTDTATGVFGVLRTEDLDGIEFDEAPYREAMARLDEYLRTEGAARLTHRLLSLGFIAQEPRHVGRPHRNVLDNYSERTDLQVCADEEELALSSSSFVQLACACGQVFVRSALQGSDWACPACRVDDGVAAMADDDGPERLLHKEGPLE